MKRSLSLDIFKLCLSLFVIAGHLHPLFGDLNLIGWLIPAGVSRVLVPCFFMMNGYFLFTKIDSWTSIKKYITHLLIVYAIWSLLYLTTYYEGTGIVTIVGRLLMGYHHLWYVPALILGVLILKLALMYIKNDIQILVIILFIYLLGHVLDPSRAMAYHYRNGLFIGFPFITIGYFIRKYDVKAWFKSSQLVAIVVVSFATLMLESTLNYYNGLKVTDMYLSALMLCPASLLLILKHPLLVNRSTLTDYFGELSTGVYYIHVFFIHKFYSDNYNIYNIPTIFFLSILATIPIIFINKRFRYFL